MKSEENILGYEKISKLMIKFSIPCIVAMLVNSLYNIVDQIFIGWGVGYLGNGATNVVFPLTMISLAFALMFGDGTASYLSLKLGEKNKKDAVKGVVNGVFLSVIVSILTFIIYMLFLTNLLDLFGCTKLLKNYALNYGYIISIGLPFMMIGTTLNSIIRADGSPKYAMISMLIGAILNIILDPIFIFIFHLGVKGAAYATIIGQIVTFTINVLYIKRFKSIKIKKKDIKLDKNIMKKISIFGISSFITQMSIVLVIAFENNLLSKYGATSKYGAEIPITVLGIVMKINQILNSIILGIAIGAQPIIGYNYGASKYDRVKKTLKLVLCISTIISTISFVLFQTIPDKLILIFGSGNKLYIEFACLAFRSYLLLVICNGIQIPSGIFFQAIGKGVKSAILSLSRQVVLLIPAMVIFGNLFGIKGVLYSGPFADFFSFILAVSFLIFEVKSLNVKKVSSSNNKVLEDDKNIDKKPIIITIAREYGSGGRYIGKMVADKLKITCYDNNLAVMAAKKIGLDKDYVEDIEQKKNILDDINNLYYYGLSNADELFIAESEIIKDIAKKHSCVIVGRCADFILKNKKNVINIFIYSNMDDKVNRAVKYYGLKKSVAKKEINKINKLRENHYNYYTERKWNDPNNYDLCINSDLLGVEKTADLIVEFVKNKVK